MKNVIVGILLTIGSIIIICMSYQYSSIAVYHENTKLQASLKEAREDIDRIKNQMILLQSENEEISETIAIQSATIKVMLEIVKRMKENTEFNKKGTML